MTCSGEWQRLRILNCSRIESDYVGIVKETADPHKTLCDYDGALPRDLRQRVRAVRHLLNARPVKLRLDRTARGYHMVIIWNRKWTKVETCAIQAILGSDPMRECLNLARAKSGAKGRMEAKFWNILYEKKLMLDGKGE